MTTLERARTTLPGPWRAVCFDLDGLLVDTEPIWMDAKEELFARYGVPFDAADHVAVFGTSEVQSAEYFTRRIGPPGRRDGPDPPGVPAARRRTAPGHRDPHPGRGRSRSCTRLRGRVPVALATNTRRSLATLVLERAGLARLLRCHRHQ